MAKRKLNPALKQYNKLKKWSGEFGVGGIGTKKDKLITDLVEVMQEHTDNLNEEQLEWLEDQLKTMERTTEAPAREKRRKIVRRVVKKEAVAEEKPKKKRGRPPKKKEEPVVETVEPAVEEPTAVEVDVVEVEFTLSQVKEFAKELGVDTRGYRKETQGPKLAEKVYKEIDNLSDEEREELSKPCFKFYNDIRTQISVEPEEVEDVVAANAEAKIAAQSKEFPSYSPAKIKVWAGSLGIDRTGKSDEEVLNEILEIYEEEVEEQDEENLPDSLVEWAKEALERETIVQLPDFNTLKIYGRAVGFKLADIRKAKNDPETLASMVLEAYNSEEEEDYPPELVDFYHTVMKDVQAAAEPEETEEPIIDWLEACGYDRDDLLSVETGNELVELLRTEYESEETRKAIPEDAINFLKDTFPELFKEEKKVVKKKVRKIKK